MSHDRGEKPAEDGKAEHGYRGGEENKKSVCSERKGLALAYRKHEKEKDRW
jgi:hypothetical protein